MAWYRLKVAEVLDGQSVTSYTRWVDAVQVRGAENEEVCVTFSPRFEHIWLESKKLLLDSLAQKTCCYRSSQQVCHPPVYLGEKPRLNGKKARHIGRTSRSARTGFSKGRRWECYPGSALGDLGELPQPGLIYGHERDQQEDRF